MYMPQKCTQAFGDEYLAANDGKAYDYWTDRHAVQLVDDPSLHVGNASLWTSRRNHLVHCQYYLCRLARVLKSGEYLGQDYHSVSLSDHVDHCVMLMANSALKSPAEELDVTEIYTGVSLGFC